MRKLSTSVDWRDRKLISDLYLPQAATLRTRYRAAESAVIGRGVCKSYLLSPSLFNIFMEVMTRSSHEHFEQGVKVDEEWVEAV